MCCESRIATVIRRVVLSGPNLDLELDLEGDMSRNEPKLRSSSMRKAQERRLNVLAHHFASSEELASLSLVGHTLSAKRKGVPVVIGGMVLDIQASPTSHDIQRGTTTPGEVHYVRGGVGRNIAECLARLDEPPFLISVVGNDMAGESLLVHWHSLGLSVDGIRRCAEASTPIVSAVFDVRGEVAAAVADTQAVDVHLTPDWIEGFATEIQSAPVILLDANLHPLALEAACKLANDADVPVWFEPVSIAKAVRATGLLKAITFVSPNKAEVVAMAEALHPKKTNSEPLVQGITIRDSTGSEDVMGSLGWELWGPIREILQAGVKYIVLTLGSEGAVLCSQLSFGNILYHHYPALPASVVKLSGAGDCLVAGTLAALSRRLVEVQAVAYGIAAAKFAVESDVNVPQTLTWQEISDSAKCVLAGVRTLVLS